MRLSMKGWQSFRLRMTVSGCPTTSAWKRPTLWECIWCGCSGASCAGPSTWRGRQERGSSLHFRSRWKARERSVTERKRLLVVEDEEIILADLTWTLRRQGYEIAGTAC